MSHPQRIDFENPLMTGLEFARTDDPATAVQHPYYFPTSNQAHNIKLDMYHHPDKRDNQLRRYLRCYGMLTWFLVYGLGAFGT